MADTAFQTMYRDEFIAGYERRTSLLSDTVTSEFQTKGNQCVFLVADSGGATAVTRGTNGRIPARSDNLTQVTATLAEYHDKVERTGFNIFASQGDGRAIMQQTNIAVLNRKADDLIVDELNTATNDTGLAVPASLSLVVKAKVILGNNKVPFDGQVFALATPAFMGYLMQTKEFASAEYVSKKPMEDGTGWTDQPGYYNWMGVKWIEHPELPGVGTNAEKCFMYHKSAIGKAAPANMIDTFADYNQEDDYSYARATAYMAAKLLQNSGVVVINHDGSAFAAA